LPYVTAWDPRPPGGCWVVELDGVRLRDCFAADSEHGWADVYARDASGRKMLNKKRDGVVMRRMYGNVRIYAGLPPDNQTRKP
jgi:hypothetical protein